MFSLLIIPPNEFFLLFQGLLLAFRLGFVLEKFLPSLFEFVGLFLVKILRFISIIFFSYRNTLLTKYGS